jgi:superfamily II DNA helicase RecQ
LKQDDGVKKDIMEWYVSQVFGFPELTKNHEGHALEAVVLKKKDVFVNLPTGSGKSLIFETMPLMFALSVWLRS